MVSGRTGRLGSGRPEVALGDLANEQWAATPGDGCFADCFTSACAKAGFIPRTQYETDVMSCLDMVEAGDAVVLCQPMFRQFDGLVAVPIAGIPLRWRHLIGWHPEGPAVAMADEIIKLATLAYFDVIAKSLRYSTWLRDHQGYGVDPALTLTHPPDR